MPNEEQQQATNPGIVEGLGNAITSPFTKGADGYNLAGALLFGAGTGLTTWLLSRMFGMKGGPSLAASILAGLGGAHVALTKQGGGDYLNPNYWKDIMDRKRVDPNGDADAAMRAEQEAMLKQQQEQKYSKNEAPLTNKTFDIADQGKGTMSLAPAQNGTREGGAEFLWDATRNTPANLSPSELAKGETESLANDKGRKEYLNMIRNGMVTPDAHARAIENGIKARPEDPQVQEMIDAYSKRKDIDNTAAQERRVALFKNRLQNAINSRRDPFGEADARMRMEAEYPEAFRQPVEEQPYSQEAINALSGNYPTAPKQVTAKPAEPVNADAARNAAIAAALQRSSQTVARRQALHEQDAADVAKRVDAIKREQAMQASLNNAQKQKAMEESMRRAVARQDAMNASMRQAAQGLAMQDSLNSARRQMAMDDAMTRSKRLLPPLPSLPKLPKIPSVNSDIRAAINNQPGYVNPFSPYK